MRTATVLVTECPVCPRRPSGSERTSRSSFLYRAPDRRCCPRTCWARPRRTLPHPDIFPLLVAGGEAALVSSSYRLFAVLQFELCAAIVVAFHHPFEAQTDQSGRSMTNSPGSVLLSAAWARVFALIRTDRNKKVNKVSLRMRNLKSMLSSDDIPVPGILPNDTWLFIIATST